MTKIQPRLLLFTSKLFSQRSAVIRNASFRTFSRNSANRTVNEERKNDRLEEEDSDYDRKIIYNEILYKQVKEQRFTIRKQYIENRKERLESLIKDEKFYTPSLCVKYLTESQSQTNPIEEKKSSTVHFPFDIKTKYLENHEEEKMKDNFDNISKQLYIESPNKHINERNFIQDGLEDDAVPYDVRYGTADPKVPPSSVPCGGCGAHLHCTDMAVPGFIPKEVFTDLTEVELRSVICQRCHFLKEYDMALGVNVSNDEYPRILSQIQNEKALALIMVDLLDFPCSIWPNILDVIGRDRPVVIVGNKIDLFVQDGDGFTKHMKNCLLRSLEEQNFEMENIKHVALISAKTGYGVENLISKILHKWGTQGDIYLIGCTNVGKSTLFNLLIQSDLCKLKAVDILQRATTSYWPGTTLNLLKFPILKPNKERLYLRTGRLIELAKERRAKEAVLQSKKNKSFEKKQYSLSETVERTYFPGLYEYQYQEQDVFTESPRSKPTPIGLDPDDEAFVDGKWCYDTPGVVNPDQILNLLTTAELVKTVPKEMILPRNFHLKPGYSLFIGGLARLDFLSGSDIAWFTVFASKDLPITITKTEDAEYVYNKLLGTDYFVVPVGTKERLKMWPFFKSEVFQIVGKYANVAAGDVVLSSAGWVAVTLKAAEFINVEAWTPEGRGLHLRQPAVVREASLFKGKKIAGTPAFHVNIKIADDELEGMEEMESDEEDENS